MSVRTAPTKDAAIRAYQRSIDRFERDLRESTLGGDPAIAHRAIVTEQLADYRRRLDALRNAA